MGSPRALRHARPDLRQWPLEHELYFHPPRLAHHTEAPKAIHRRQCPPDRKPHPRQALHPNFAPLASAENPDRAPRRLRIVDAERAVPASRPEARKPEPRSRAKNAFIRGGNPYSAGRPVKAVIRRIGHRWEAVVCYEVPAPQQNDNGRFIGVDRNAGQVADSDGEIHRMPHLALLETKLRRHQRGLAKKRKGSRRRARQCMRGQRAQRRLANARKNRQHHVSRRIAAKAQTVVIGKLNTRGMTKSAKGTTGKPGRNVRQKAGLNRVILHTGWAALGQMLSY